MDNFLVNSTPELISPCNKLHSHAEPHMLEGVGTEVKLLLKLIHEHNASARETDGRRPQRLATMLTILDDIRSRVHKSQSCVPNRRAELRRCTTELHRNNNINDNSTNNASPKEKDKEKKPPLSPAGAAEDHHLNLRRQLSANMTARKGLEKMFYSLGKEKELIASELSRKVQETSSLEELVSDLRAQNERLSEKVKKGYDSGGGEAAAGDEMLQERNRQLSEQLIKTLEGYKDLKRRLKDAMEERERTNGKIAETVMEAAAGIERVRRLREGIGSGDRQCFYEHTVEELCALERVFAGFYRKLLMAATARGSSRDSPKRTENGLKMDEL